MLPNFSYVRPKTIEESTRQLKTPGTRVHAGGTDLLGCLHDGVFNVRKMVSISNIAALRGITETSDGGLSIGALTTLSEIAAHPQINRKYEALAQGAQAAASPQLRNQGTIGGNICQKPRCWYYRGEFHCLRKGGDKCYAVGGENQFHAILGGDRCFMVHPSDPSPTLVAFGATARISGAGGRREVPLEKFHVPPTEDPRRETVLRSDEIVTHILLPSPPHGLRSSYRKIRARQSWDFALAGIALALQMEGDRVTWGRAVLSGGAPVPWRSKAIERVIVGRRLDDDTIARAAKAGVENAVPLSKNGYKINLFRGLIAEELQLIRKG